MQAQGLALFFSLGGPEGEAKGNAVYETTASLGEAASRRFMALPLA